MVSDGVRGGSVVDEAVVVDVDVAAVVSLLLTFVVDDNVDADVTLSLLLLLVVVGVDIVTLFCGATVLAV